MAIQQRHERQAFLDGFVALLLAMTNKTTTSSRGAQRRGDPGQSPAPERSCILLVCFIGCASSQRRRGETTSSAAPPRKDEKPPSSLRGRQQVPAATQENHPRQTLVLLLDCVVAVAPRKDAFHASPPMSSRGAQRRGDPEIPTWRRIRPEGLSGWLRRAAPRHDEQNDDVIASRIAAWRSRPIAGSGQTLHPSGLLRRLRLLAKTAGRDYFVGCASLQRRESRRGKSGLGP